MKKALLSLLVCISTISISGQITWMGDEWTSLSANNYLGDQILFEIQSYPRGDNQGAQVYIDWGSKGYYGSTQNVDWFGLGWISTANNGNNSKWNSYVTMREVGRHNRKYLGWQSGKADNVTENLGTFDVLPLENPDSPSKSNIKATTLKLSWNKWNSKNVMIVRRLTSDAASNAPVQRTAYTVGASLGTGTVVYNGSGVDFSDSGLAAEMNYTYTLYSVNNDYYSAGAEINATTDYADWIGLSYVNIGGTSGTWYKCSGDASDKASFLDADLGKFDKNVMSSITLGGELQVFPKSNTSAKLHYNIDDNVGEFTHVLLPHSDEVGNNSKHYGETSIDLTSLSIGSHDLFVYFQGGELYDGSTNAGFKATFTPAATETGTGTSSNTASFKATFTIEDTSTGLKNPEFNVKTWAANGKILARFDGQANIQLYSIAGLLIHSEIANNQFAYAIKSGAYIVKINGKVSKVAVK